MNSQQRAIRKKPTQRDDYTIRTLREVIHGLKKSKALSKKYRDTQLKQNQDRWKQTL